MFNLNRLHLQDLRMALDWEVACAVALMQVLEREHGILSQRDSAALEAVVEEKRCHTQRLQEASMAREEAMRAISAQGDLYGRLQTDTAQLGEELVNAWRAIESIADRLRRQNETNGRVIEMRYRQCEQALSILQGRGLDTELYHPSKSRPSVQTPARCLAKA